MKYKCENELNTLNFRDFGLTESEYDGKVFSIMTDGGVAKYDNSCNETLEERYISETQIRIIDASILDFYLEGAKYYDANDVLLKETPDEPVASENYNSIIKKFSKGTLFFLGEKSSENGKDENGDPFKVFELAIDIEEDTYWIKIRGSKIIIEFDRFMNRVAN